MTAADYVGVAGLITSTSAAIVAIIVALRQTGTKAQVEAIHGELRTSNGTTVGEIVERNDLLGGDHGT